MFNKLKMLKNSFDLANTRCIQNGSYIEEKQCFDLMLTIQNLKVV